MSSSDDDMPLAGKMNGAHKDRQPHVSPEVIPKSVDMAAGKSTQTNGATQPGISMRNGPVTEDVEMSGTNGVNGVSKRKARPSASRPDYAEAESSEDDNIPLSKRRKVTSKQEAALESDSDDAPLVSKGKEKKASLHKPPRASFQQMGESDSDEPLGKKLAAEKSKIEKKAEQQARELSKNEKKNTKPSASTPKKKANGVKREDSSDDAPLKKVPPAKKSAKPTKSEPSTPAKKGKGKAAVKTEQDEEELEAEEEYRWWQDPTKGDGTIKWTTLQHNGVVFPPPYELLPKNVKMKYDGVPVTMEPEAEEVAGFFGTMLNSTHNVENPTFQKNFFHDFKAILKKTGGAKDKNGDKVGIDDFKKCDFTPIFEFYTAQREAKKALPAAEKKALKAEKDKIEEPYMYCMWDGRKQKVGNFRVEPPGLFRGRGEHPKTGHVKTRVQPEQITINIGKEAKVPAPPEGHKWKEVKHDQEGTWLAMWQENINGNYKYVMLAANSDVKGQSDYRKFEKARELKKHIARIRKDYRAGLKDELMVNRQRATAMYLIDQLALRAGNEKGEDEAETVGCCSLKYEHVTLKPPDIVIFDFLGKDSIRYYDEVKVDPQVFKNLKIFKKPPKEPGDQIFDRLSTSALNKHLSGYMDGLTAKVFRTYNASHTMSTLLDEINVQNGSNQEKKNAYDDANRKVAILCNHKRTVTAGHAGQMEKLGDRIKGLLYQQWRLRQMMLAVEPKLKKKKGAEFFDLPEELDEEWIQAHQEYLVEEEKKKITKKFETQNAKLKEQGEKEMKQSELKERLHAADELEKKFKKENKSKKVEPEGKAQTVEKYEENIKKLNDRITALQLQAENKESNKEVALGTSKINYIDPRLTVVFCKKFNCPIETFFSKTLREKFEWALKSVDEDWRF